MRRITFSEYLAVEADNWSRLKHLRMSPLHYRHAIDNPRDETAALAVGRAFHCAVLEPERFAAEYVSMPPEFAEDRSLNRATKEGKERWRAWLETHPGDDGIDADTYKARVFASLHPGTEVLSVADYARVVAMGSAMRAHPLIRPYLEVGVAEQSIEWTDEATGLKCKARLDWIPSASVFCDLKSARSIVYHRFAAQAWGLGYFHQLAFYRRGMQAVSGQAQTPIFLAIESDAPHDCAAFEPDADALYAADEDLTRLLATLKRCRELDEWPGMYDGPQLLKAPGWVFADEEEVEDLGLVFPERRTA